jgi:RNA 2',3'-cyclic 3'-phosphodiesterase
VTLPGTVGGDERIRLFCALRLPDDFRSAVVEWQHGALAAADDVRIVPPENLHVTLAFLGHRPSAEVPAISAELRAAARAASPILLRPRRYRQTRSVGMLELDDAVNSAAALADELHGRLERIGVYRREQRPWLPHLTVVRFRSRPRLDVDPPGIGPVVPSDAALYHSVLRSRGAQYEVVDAFALNR